MDNMRKIYPNVEYCSSAQDAAIGADLLVLLTDWYDFTDASVVSLAEVMRNKAVFDTRNFWDPANFKSMDFQFKNYGRCH